MSKKMTRAEALAEVETYLRHPDLDHVAVRRALLVAVKRLLKRALKVPQFDPLKKHNKSPAMYYNGQTWTWCKDEGSGESDDLPPAWWAAITGAKKETSVYKDFASRDEAMQAARAAYFKLKPEDRP